MCTTVTFVNKMMLILVVDWILSQLLCNALFSTFSEHTTGIFPSVFESDFCFWHADFKVIFLKIKFL